MHVARKILMNTGAQVAAKAILAAIGFVTVKIITNYLDLAGYGYYSRVYDFIAFFGIASDLGLYTIAVREMARNEEKVDKIIGNILSLRIILITITMTLATGASFFIFPAGTDFMIPLAVGVASVATMFALLSGTVSTVLQVNYKMQFNAVGSVVGKVFALAYLLYIIFLWNPDPTTGFYHLFAAGVVGNIAMFGITFFYARKYAKLKLQLDWKYIKNVVVKSLPYGISLILNNLYFRLGALMLIWLGTPEDSALYSVPLRILEAIAIVPLYFMNAVLPTLSQTIKEKSQQYKKIIQASFDALVMGGVSMAVGMATIAYPVIFLLSKGDEYLSRLDEGFYGSDIILQIVIFALAFSFINTLFGFILVAANKQSKLLYVNGSGAILAIILNFIFIPWLGARGAAVTDIFVEMFVALAAYIFAKRYLDFKINLTNTFKIILAGIIMGATVWYAKDPTYHMFGLQNLNIILLIPLGGIVYIGLLFLMRVITPEMLALLRRTKPKEAEHTPGEELS